MIYAILEEFHYLNHLFSFMTLVIFLICFYKWLFTSNIAPINLPPSPPRVPILGNLHQLGKLPHWSLRSMSQRYGPLMSLHIGSKPTLVVSSASAAQEILKTHDLIFSNRPNITVARILLYDGKDVAFANYGEYWRKMKSICVLQLFSNKKVQSFRQIREEETSLMVEKIKCLLRVSSAPVNLSEIITAQTNAVICRSAFGMKFADEKMASDINKLMADFSKALGTFSMQDFIPWLGWVDKLRGLKRMARRVANKLDGFVEKILQEHLDRGNKLSSPEDVEVDDSIKHEKMQDFVEILLQIHREDSSVFPRDSVKALLLDMLAAGTETTYTFLEWAMTELLKKPQIMEKLQQDVRAIVRDKAGVTENDLQGMKYLQAVIKETFRLHPPLPLLVFRESSQDVKICGYDIAARTQVIINAWAIQRDSTYWEEPEEFNPERFLNSSIDFKGQHFELIPFGAGRRGCPAASYSAVNAELVLANLVYSFDWKLPGESGRHSVEVPETWGTIVRRHGPLLAIPISYISA